MFIFSNSSDVYLNGVLESVADSVDLNLNGLNNSLKQVDTVV